MDRWIERLSLRLQDSSDASVVSHLLHNHNGRFGRFAVLMQILNLIFWLPVALNISASALQFIVNADGGAGACNVLYPALLATFAGVATLCIRSFTEGGSAIALVSCSLILVKAVLIAVECAAARGSLNPSRRHAPLTPRGSWLDLFAAIGNLSYGIAAVFISAELTAEMRRPQQATGAVVVGGSLMFLVYLVCGLAGAIPLGAGVGKGAHKGNKP